MALPAEGPDDSVTAYEPTGDSHEIEAEDDDSDPTTEEPASTEHEAADANASTLDGEPHPVAERSDVSDEQDHADDNQQNDDQQDAGETDDEPQTVSVEAAASNASAE